VLAHQQRAGLELALAGVGHGGDRGQGLGGPGDALTLLLAMDGLEVAGGVAVEVAQGVGLEALGQDTREQRAAEVIGGGLAGQLAVAGAQGREIEAGEGRDLGGERVAGAGGYVGGRAHGSVLGL
jgi:hypothetical protein